MANPKDLQDYIPVLKDQGIKNVVGSPSTGVSIQVAEFTMVSSPDDFVFADAGLENMADGNYHVLALNQTDATDQATIDSKTAAQFTINGPDAADVVTLLIVGQVDGQAKIS